jgi:hypothetical protein
MFRGHSHPRCALNLPSPTRNGNRVRRPIGLERRSEEAWYVCSTFEMGEVEPRSIRRNCIFYIISFNRRERWAGVGNYIGLGEAWSSGFYGVLLTSFFPFCFYTSMGLGKTVQYNITKVAKRIYDLLYNIIIVSDKDIVQIPKEK